MQIARPTFETIAATRPNWVRRPATPGVPYHVQIAYAAPQAGAQPFAKALRSIGYAAVRRDGEKAWRRQLANRLILEIRDLQPAAPGTGVYRSAIRLLAPEDASGLDVLVSPTGDAKRDLGAAMTRSFASLGGLPVFVGSVADLVRPRGPSAVAARAVVELLVDVQRSVESVALPANAAIPDSFTPQSAD